MNLLLPGTYVAANTVVHRLDPRLKMAASLLLMTVPFAAPGLPSALVLSAFVGIVAVVAAVPALPLLRTLRTVFWLALFMFVFYLFTTPGRAAVNVGSLVITWEGLLAGGTQIYRLCLLVVVAVLTTFTTSPSQLTHGVEAILGPLDRAGLPVRELAMVLTISLRFVPTLFEELDKIVKAQQARGMDLRTGNPWQRVRNTVPVFVPIFVAALRRAEELAMAMEARGFRGAHRRTRLCRLSPTRTDLAASLIVLSVAAAAFWLDRWL